MISFLRFKKHVGSVLMVLCADVFCVSAPLHALAPGFPGEYQVDVQVPAGVANGDDIPVTITMAGLSDTATVSVQPRYGIAPHSPGN